ncbi:MAG: TIM barrel protein [Acidobacteriota bacterium]|nr:TIM barrel protein [Acidobacteriota bacterium]
MNRFCTRREALGAVAAAWTPFRAAAAPYRPRISVACYIATQQFAARGIRPLDGLEETFRGFREAGFRRVELIDSFLTRELRERTLALMKQFDLSCSMAYHGGPMHEDDGAARTIAATVELAKAVQPLGAEGMVINCDPLPHNLRKTDEQLRTEASNLERLGRELRALGMKPCLHHHAPDLAEGGREWLYMLHNTDPGLVWMCPDADWIRFAKLDIVGVLREAGRRIADIHLRNSVDGVWTEDLGPGDVDYAAVARSFLAIGYDGYLCVELGYAKETKVTRSLVENLRRSREFVERTFEVKAD